MKPWKVKVFIKVRGTNVIKDWFKKDKIPNEARSAIDRLLRHMEVLEKWDDLQCLKKRRGTDCIQEVIIKWGGNQYRPLGFFGPKDREFTLLIGAKEKDHELIPRGADTIAEKRRKMILDGKGEINDYF